MWSVVFTVALMCGASLGSPLKFEIPREFRPESPFDNPVHAYRSPIFTPARPLVDMLETPDMRARLVEKIEQLFEETKLPCTSNLRTTMFVALLHLEGNLVAVETGLFKERAVEPLLEELDTATRTKVVDAIHMVSKELLEKPIMEGLGSGEIKRNEYVEAIVMVLRRLETVIRSRELFTFTDLELVMRPLFTSLSKVHDCSLLISRQQVLDVCQRIIARMTKPGLVETSLKTLEHTLTTTIRDTTTATYMRDMLETLTTKYVSLMTYTMTSLTTLLRSEVRPTALLVDWMYCLTMMPASRIEASKYIKYPVARTFQEFPTTWKYPHITFLASTMVPPVSPLAHLIIIVYQNPYPVHESHVPIQRLKESVLSEVRELSLPKPTDSCYLQRMAAYNSVLVVLINMVDQRMLNTTCFEMVKELSHSDAFPHYMQKSQKWALWQEVMRLKTELLLPQRVAVETILEVPELFTILRSSNLLEFINSPRDITFPALISTIKNTLNLVKTSPSLCNVEVHSINRRIGHVLTTIGSSLPWESVEIKLTEGLLNFCEMHKLTISKPSLYKIISSLRPVFEMRVNHKLSIVDELLTCFLEERIIPDVLANLLITMKIKIADLAKFIMLPTSALPREIVFTRINIAFTKIPMQKRYPVYDVTIQRLKESVWSEVRELSLPTPTESCYPQRLAAYNSVLVVLLNMVDRMMFNTTCTDLVKEISYSNVLPLYMENAQQKALWQEILRLKTELLLPQTVAVETLLEVPELLTILRYSNLAELINSPHDISFPRVISTFKNALNLIKTSDSLCHVEVHGINRRIEHVIATIRSSLTWEAVEIKLTEGLLNFCEIHKLTVSKPYLYEIISRIRPVFEMHANHKVSIVNDFLTCFREERIIPDVLANLLITMKMKIVHLEKFITLPTSAVNRENVLPSINIAFPKISTVEGLNYFPEEGKLEDLPEIRMLSFPSKSDPCFMQKFAAFNTLLVELLHGADRKAMDSTLGELLTSSDFSFGKINPEILRSIISTLNSKLFLPERNAIETYLEIPELRDILKTSEVFKVIEFHDFTFRDIMAAIKTDLHLIKGSKSLCTMDVSRVQHLLEAVFATMETSFSVERIEPRLFTLLRTNFNNIISESLIYEIVNRITPVLKIANRRRASLINVIRTDIRLELIPTDVLSHVLLTFKRISDFRIASRAEYNPYYPRSPVGSYKMALLSEVRTISIPLPTEPCYSQKVAAYHAVLVELLHGLNSTIIETTLHHFMELPSVTHLLSSLEDTFHPGMIALTLKKELFSEMEAIKALSEIPEVHRLLEESELVHLIKSRIVLTFPAVLAALKEDLTIIRNSDYLCTADVHTVHLNAEHYLTTLRTLFSWETIQHKLITGLRRTFEKVGLVHEISDYKLIVNALRPVFERLTLPYINTVETLRTTVRHERISTDLLYHTLITLHELLVPTVEIIPMEEPFRTVY